MFWNGKEAEFCFICRSTNRILSSHSETNNWTQICDRFRNYLKTFLNPESNHFQNDGVELVESYKTFICCDQCFKDVETFCEMCESLELRQAEMVELVVTISNLVGFKSNSKIKFGVPNKISETCSICQCEAEETMAKSTKSVITVSSQIKPCPKFTTLFTRYISNTKKPRFEKGILEKIGKFQNSPKFYCSDKCLPTVETFCEMYEALDSLQLEIFRILQIISTKIIHSDNLNVPRDYQMIPIFWKDFPCSVEQKRCQHYPRVNLKRLPLPEAPVNPNVEPEYQNNDVDEMGDLCESTGISSALTPEDPEEKLGVGDDDDDADDIQNLEFASLTSHKKSKSVKNLKRKRVGRTRSLNFQYCPFCPKTFTMPCLLEIHLLTHTTEKPFICRICLIEYSTRGGLAIHQKRKFHFPEKLMPHICQHCRKAYQYRHNLITHVKMVHEGLSQFKCKMCEKYFRNSFNYERHRKTHVDDDKRFSCEICKKLFLSKEILRGHTKRVHAIRSDKEFKCSFPNCDSSFSAQKDLHRHMIRHTGEKGFQCNECGKSFGLIENLRNHQLLHKPVRRFNCSKCGKGFNFRHELTKHEIKYHSN